MIDTRAINLAAVKIFCTFNAHVVEKQLTAVNNNKQAAAISLTAFTGGAHSGKKGLMAYVAKVMAQMAKTVGRIMTKVTQRQRKAKHSPKDTNR